jgi:predicted DNA-binding WGR domain protein
MPDKLRSPIKHHLVLHRIDAEQGTQRFYSLMIELERRVDRLPPCCMPPGIGRQAPRRYNDTEAAQHFRATWRVQQAKGRT